MLTTLPESGTSTSSPPHRPPLGLPAGSVRALLTLLIVAVVIVQLARQQEVELLWTETLMIALAHYFTSRRFIRLPPEVVKQLTDAGELEQEWHPLYLPRNSIRTILILSFAGLGAYLFLQGKLLQSQALPILGVVFAYAFGIVARMRSTRTWEDFKALAVIAVLVCTAAPYLAGHGNLVPGKLRDLTLGFVLFYFGSR